MLEATASVALALLIGREFLALGAGPASQRRARLAGLAAMPFLLAFGVLFAMRVGSYLN